MSDTNYNLEWVRDKFVYSKGNLYWKYQPCPWINIGDKVGSLRKDGYWETQVDGKRFLIHRLIYLLHFGTLPKVVDHIDRNPSNNDIENLQKADKRINAFNRDPPKNNKSGKTGVSWDKKTCKWTVRWKEENGKYSFLGYFEDLNEAIEVRTQKEKESQMREIYVISDTHFRSRKRH